MQTGWSDPVDLIELNSFFISEKYGFVLEKPLVRNLNFSCYCHIIASEQEIKLCHQFELSCVIITATFTSIGLCETVTQCNQFHR